ncbi:Phosphoribosylaminoimidazole-succinocarboxamide synthase [Roseimaritima multifibrata]|uniref:Phosphoribosylaminoimidazole-succinocarboxamide synthase n=1 Tax=Roseimaritima multifibrata TaxID=1930274 RepID=A0A517MKI5_9BACT|nr:phosphoribosylaminoimidazolesuccinocarboxamide synthase [Roseimaritima multifibrata]QDS95401.1 Phosphoribosylaminoimidazole-succinocarboxamide synthase [Roseimaritima multifibrata]
MSFEIDNAGALMKTDLPLPKRSGKVRDCYDLGDSMLIVSTDRISAFDWILPVGIPGKGRLLTAMSQFWFDLLKFPNHLISCELPEEKLPGIDLEPLQGRSMVVRKASVIPFECVARGYLEGSGWREYLETGAVCDCTLPAGLQQCDQLPETLFTPATKAEEGHDENVSYATMAASIGESLADQLRTATLDIYRTAAEYAAKRGILIADTKFEFGQVDGELILIDEVLTPDSSRFWAADAYKPGNSQPSFDKQFVRQWLSETDWDRNSPPPALPAEIISRTQAKYQEAYDRLVTVSE